MLSLLKAFIRNKLSFNTYQVYTDGSQKDGWGSWAFIVTQKNQILHESAGKVRKANSNQMEFTAAIKALQFLPPHAKVQLFTDSRILIQTMLGEIAPVAFEKLATEIKSSNQTISWHWVKAHSGNQLNERCDQLCIQARST